MARSFLALFVLALVLLVATPAQAGGAAIVTVDELPAEVHAGDTVRLDFVVRQHGVQPVDEFEGVGPVEPYLLATHVESGDTLRAAAWKPEGAEPGRFAVETSFPLEGTWEWRIEPAPFELMNPFEPLSVLPAVAATATESNAQAVTDGAALQQALRLLGAGFVLGAMGLATLRWRRARRGEVLVESP